VIIQCKKCGKKYRFDESLIDSEGIWVRCSHCKTVFFQQNPSAEVTPSPDLVEPGGNLYEKTFDESSEAIDSALTKDEADDYLKGLGREKEYGDAGEGMDNVAASGDEQKPRRAPGRKITIFLILVLLLSAGIYLWTSSRTIEVVLNRVLPQVEKFVTALPGAEKFFGTKRTDTPSECLSGLDADLINIKERFVKNWVTGSVIAVEGVVVNTNQCAVSNVRVKGKILDSSGKTLSEEESICGNILTDDELKGLTKEEITKELSNSYGRDFPNADIEPGASIPFMLVFVMPDEKASEFIVELADIQRANMK